MTIQDNTIRDETIKYHTKQTNTIQYRHTEIQKQNQTTPEQNHTQTDNTKPYRQSSYT